MRKSNRTLLSLRKTATLLEIPVSQLSGEAKRDGFPSVIIDGAKRFDPDQVREWRSKNIKIRGASGGLTTPQIPTPANDVNVVALKSETSSAVELARAGARVAARRLADGAIAGAVGASALNDLKASLENLRRAEVAHLNLEARRRQLIARDEVTQIAAGMVARLVRCFSGLETKVTAEVEQWIHSDTIRAMPTDQRQRLVREFIGKAGREIRTMESDGIEKLIDAQAEDE